MKPNRFSIRTPTAITFSLLLLLGLAGCGEGSQKFTTFALTKGGKTYLYSTLGKMITEASLKEGSAPALIPQTGFVVVGGEYYLDPSNMEAAVNIVSGNVEIIAHQEKSYEGYLVEGDQQVYDVDYKEESTETIGVMRSTTKVTLTHPYSGKQKVITWVRSPKLEAIENCEVVKITKVTNPHPGETVVSKDKMILIPVGEVLSFFAPGTTVEYDGKNEVVYFIQ